MEANQICGTQKWWRGEGTSPWSQMVLLLPRRPLRFWNARLVWPRPAANTSIPTWVPALLISILSSCFSVLNTINRSPRPIYCVARQQVATRQKAGHRVINPGQFYKRFLFLQPCTQSRGMFVLWTERQALSHCHTHFPSSSLWLAGSDVTQTISPLSLLFLLPTLDLNIQFLLPVVQT